MVENRFDECYLSELKDCLEKCNAITRVEIWTELLANHPDFLTRCSSVTQIEVYKELLLNHPDSQSYKDELRKALGYFETLIGKWLKEKMLSKGRSTLNLEILR